MQKFLLSISFFCLLANAACAQVLTIQNICTSPWGGQQPAVGSIDSVEFQHVGVNRYYCVYVPTNYGALPDPNRIVFAFHGGNGNASVLMEDPKKLIDVAEANDYMVVFGQGMPPGPASNPVCNTGLSGKNGWSDRDCAVSKNVDYTREMITKVMSDYSDVEQTQVFFVGFSGGAKHIYTLVSQWTSNDPTIAAFATMAGSMFKLTFDGTDGMFEQVPILQGSPTPGLLFHGKHDNRMNIDGGISPRQREISGSFQMKVETVVALNTQRDANGNFILDSNNDDALVVETTPWGYPPLPTAPTGVSGKIWPVVPGASKQVADTVAIVGTNLKHRWKGWMSDEVFRFFNNH